MLKVRRYISVGIDVELKPNELYVDTILKKIKNVPIYNEPEVINLYDIEYTTEYTYHINFIIDDGNGNFISLNSILESYRREL